MSTIERDDNGDEIGRTDGNGQPVEDHAVPAAPPRALGVEDLAQIGYQAYAEHTGGKNYRGEPMPSWAELPDPQHGAWLAAAAAIALHAQAAPANTLPVEVGALQVSADTPFQSLQLAPATDPLARLGLRVLYTLTSDDAEQINRRRGDYDAYRRQATQVLVGEPGSLASGQSGHVGHTGNTASEGDVFPADVVRIFDRKRAGCVNLQVHLDGNDTLWATSRYRGDGPGEWLPA
jgi:hypothetical protein